MPSLILNNCVQLRLIWQLSNADWAVNVLTGIRDDVLTPVGQDQADNLAAALVTRKTSVDWNTMSPLVKLARIGLRDVNSANNPEFVGVPGTPIVGVSNSNLLPLQTAACVTLRTAKAGASYRGRIYWGGFTELQGDGGVMSANVQTQARNLAVWVQNAMSDAGYTLAVGSRKLGEAQPVTSIVVRDNLWDTQRRRAYAGI